MHVIISRISGRMFRKRIGIRPALAGSIFSGYSLPNRLSLMLAPMTGAMHFHLSRGPMVEGDEPEESRECVESHIFERRSPPDQLRGVQMNAEKNRQPGTRTEKCSGHPLVSFILTARLHSREEGF
jgi:hypothetical protein